MASRLVDSSMGRQTIVKFFGHSGDSLLQTVQAVAEIVHGGEFAKSLMVDIMKITGKIGLLLSNKTIKEEAFQPVVPFLLDVASAFQYNLDLKDASQRGSKLVSESMEALYETTFNLIKSHMQEKNAAKLTRVCEYLASSAHLEPLFHDQALEAHRITMQTHINRLMNPYSDEMSATNKHLRAASKKRYEKLTKLCEKPRFATFMAAVETRPIVTGWIGEMGNRDSVSGQHLFACDFYCNVLDFKTISGRNMIKGRAGQIFAKHLREGCKKPIGVLTCSELEKIEDMVDGDNVRKDVFDVAAGRVKSLFDVLFEESFLESEAFKGLKVELTSLELRLHIDVDHDEHEEDRDSVHDPEALGLQGIKLK